MRDALFVFFVGFIVVCYGYRTEPPKCFGANEELACVKQCPPERTCRNRNIQFRCANDKKNCTEKCVCKQGFFRNAVGICITGKQCDQCCRPNEYFNCDSACDNECSKLDTQNRTNCPIKNIKCNEMCYCEDGYARDNERNCVPVDECPEKPEDCDEPTKCFGANEELACVKECPPEKTCRNRDIRFSCLEDKKKCTKKCVCKKGFFRNAVNTCVTGEQCDQCSRPKEYFSCDSACDNECSKLDTQNRTNCPILNIKCNDMCYCEDGYARDNERNCVPVDECPKKPDVCDNKKCGPNEEYKCKKSCPPERCFSLVAKFKCNSTEECVKGCYCKSGFLRMDEEPEKKSKGKKTPCIPTCHCLQIKNTPECEGKGPVY